jgi:hypothetical protein
MKTQQHLSLPSVGLRFFDGNHLHKSRTLVGELSFVQ